MAADVTAAVVSGDMPADHRADVIARFDRGEIQLLVNCMVLTEGFDSQPVGCIGILRPMLHKSTFIQAIGRGLRKVDPERYVVMGCYCRAPTPLGAFAVQVFPLRVLHSLESPA